MKMNAKFYNKLNINKKLCGAIVLAVLIISYNFIWLNKSFTLSEGWAKFYSELMEQGKIPYKDFYYYLPPLNLLVDSLIWKLSGEYFIIYRFWRLAERVLIAELMYKLISYKLPNYLSVLICFMSTVVASSNVYDLIGDYNQTVQLLVIILCYCLMNYMNAEKCKYVWSLLTGIIGGCMFLSKQTIVVSSFVVFAILVIYFIIIGKEKNFLKFIVSLILGALIPLGVSFIYLLQTHSLSQFIYQVFQNTNAKGSLFDILIGSQIGIYHTRLLQFIAIVLLFIVKWINKYGNNRKYISEVRGACIVISILLFSSCYGTVISSGILVWINSGFWVVVLIISLLVFLEYPKRKIQYMMVAFFMFVYALLKLNLFGITEKLYSTGIFNYMAELITILYIWCICWCVYTMIEGIVQKDVCVNDIIWVAGSIASAYSTSMATGAGSCSSVAAFVIIPIFLCLMFKELEHDEYKFSIKYFEIVSLIILCMCMSQKFVCSYNWWGDTQASYWEKTEESSIAALKGFKFSSTEKNKYDELTKIIDYYAEKDDIIYSFPYARVYNVFLDNYNLLSNVPILFYDVCADDFVKKEAELLYENKPQIVVWTDIPGCMEIHESVFRNGEYLAQRQIQKWFSDVKEIDYKLVGQVENVFVYKLKNETENSYTYIERKTKDNQTAYYNLQEKMECVLDGEGTKEDPYLISTADELRIFKDLVNSGMSFKNQFVLQTSDIDLSVYSDWGPIGIFGSNKIFEGNYNGDGYSIIGMTINEEGNNVGLFGVLGGTVQNVSVIDCNIIGACVGGIASHGVNATIVNCFVSGKIKGTSRASGIADNLGGNIFNCVAICELEGGEISGISGFYTNTVNNCFSNVGNNFSIDDGEAYDLNTVNKLNKYISGMRRKNKTWMLNRWQEMEGCIKLTNNN